MAVAWPEALLQLVTRLSPRCNPRSDQALPVLPEFSLSGRVAVLYTSGGDEAPWLARALAEAGASVFVVARLQKSLDAVLTALSDGDHSGALLPVAGYSDLSDLGDAFDLQYRQADILVNDARSFFAMPFLDICLAEWEEVHSRNFRSVVMFCKLFGRRMVQQQYGRIVNLISVMAERGLINGSAFSATQAGLLSLTRSLSVEWGRHNIRVNALGTGWTTAEDVPLEEQSKELLVRYTPLRRKGHPRDIGPLLVYLCSEACDYATGQPVYVDGGLNAHP
jgi:NAD(P)-dependent dehydrogenase (short-subunit alcohol dehydrogenase family)